MLSRYSNMNISLLRAIAISLFVATFVAGCASKGPTAPTEEEQSTWDAAVKHMKRKKFEKAIPILQEIIAAQPKLSGPHLNLGIAYAHTGNYEAAMTELSEALRLKPQLADDVANAWNQAGLIQVKSGQFDDAIKSYRRALYASPSYSKAQYNLALVYDIHLNDPRNALIQYRLYQEMLPKPDNAVALFIKKIELEQAALLEAAQAGEK